MGRGKIVIQRIDNATSRQVTFSKRKNGLLKKARELSILCDAQVCAIIFSSSGRLHDYASSSVKSVIERYNRMRAKDIEPNHTSEITFWQREAEKLREHINHLNEYNRKLMGEEISGLSVNDLRNLENQLERSLKSVRARKEQLLADQIRVLTNKVNLVCQDNQELHKKVVLIGQENRDLKTKVYELWDPNESDCECKPDKLGYNLNLPVHPQLSHEELYSQERDQESELSMKLRLQLD
ncbi:PREDICTED: MADS-box transcription factor 23-like isoform X2 [Tarenaya hassleriana]|uniref:MADS-box transcription factor 23-like isoform X2 n=1 Tax=Tarenaya hassleriana TaxID=28532 RepID=UPI00053C239D|nr:PREDICTED: MADS-box transcription factor 23-like isoform X2 [Tarenaya hassleriana]